MNTTTGKEQRYISYANSLDPESCTISDLIERAEPIDPDWWREQDAATREAQLHDFFTEFESAEGDPSYLREREHDLAITESEWSAHRRIKAELAEARYAASPF